MTDQELRDKAYKEQVKYCTDNKLPVFICPSGECIYCKFDLTKRYTVERFGNDIITGCPSCHRSYVD